MSDFEDPCGGVHTMMARRSLLSGVASLGISAAMSGAARSATAAAPRTKDFIDFHHHIQQPGFTLPGKPNNSQSIISRARDSIQSHLDDMDAAGIAKSILSIGSGAAFKNPTTYTKDVRTANDYLAKTVTDYPARFGKFVTLPLPDVDASLKEIEYGLDTLKADGVHLFTSYQGDKFLGDPAFDAIFAELNRRKAIVKTHPVVNPCCTFPQFDSDLIATIELGNDNARAITRVLLTGTASRYPDIVWIWSHAGGSLLGAVQRFLGTFNDEPRLAAAMPNGPEYELKRFYYDIAQAYHPATLVALKRLVGTPKILFGTDYPGSRATETRKALEKSHVFSIAELDAIGSGNGRKLLSRRAG